MYLYDLKLESDRNKTNSVLFVNHSCECNKLFPMNGFQKPLVYCYGRKCVVIWPTPNPGIVACSFSTIKSSTLSLVFLLSLFIDSFIRRETKRSSWKGPEKIPSSFPGMFIEIPSGVQYLCLRLWRNAATESR